MARRRKARKPVEEVAPFAEESWETLWENALQSFASRQFATAAPRLREAVRRSGEFPPEDLRKGDADFVLASTLLELLDLEEVEPLLLEALKLRIATFGEAHPQVALTLHRLGDYYTACADWIQAENALHSALLILDVLGEQYADDLHRSRLLWSLARPLRRTGQFLEAREHLLRGLALLEGTESGAGPSMQVLLHGDLADLSLTLLDYEGAEEHLRGALAAQESAGGPEDRLLGACCENLGDLLARRGRFGEAQPLLLRAETILAPHAAVSAELLQTRARVEFNLDRPDEAAGLWRRAAELFAQEGRHVAGAAVLEDLGWLDLIADRSAEARDRAHEGLSRLEGLPDSLPAREARAGLVRLLGFAALEEEALAEAEALFQEGHALTAPALPDEPPRTRYARALTDLGLLALLREDVETAEAMLRQANLVHALCIPPDDVDRVRALQLLAETLKRRGRLEEAVETARRVLVLQETTGGTPTELVASAASISRLYLGVPDLEEGRRFAESAARTARSAPVLDPKAADWLRELSERFREKADVDFADWLAGEALALVGAGADGAEGGP